MAEALQRVMDARILMLLVRNDSRQGVYGPDIPAGTNVPLGAFYTAVGRLEGHGFIESRWQDEGSWPSGHAATAEPPPKGKPRRRYYRITQRGRRWLVDRTATSEARAARRRAGRE